MSSQAIKTNNDPHLLDNKINLRIESIVHLDKINVLELFGGEGILWNKVRQKTGKKIKTLSIDINKYNKIQLQGDNLKFIDTLDIHKFDVIDIDGWGSPYNQLEKIFKVNYKGIIHCTFIQSMHGVLNKKMLKSLGYSDEMLNKIKSIFNKNGIEKFKSYLANKGVTHINIISKNNKNYLYFNLYN